MYAAFFALAMRSPGRQHSFRRAVVCHILLLAIVVFAAQYSPFRRTLPLLSQFMLVIGIVEGAVLIGWRLTQLPKSRSLEFLLASPLRPQRVLLAEAFIGLGRLALITLSGLPLLYYLVLTGYLHHFDLLPLLIMPFTWGTVIGLALTVWAYESLGVRQWGERLLGLVIILYLAVGVLAGEHLKSWLTWLPSGFGLFILNAFEAFHRYNPFSVLQLWMEGREPFLAWERMVGLEGVALALAGLLLARGAERLKGHFHDRHYRPFQDDAPADVSRIGDQPLSWWAVKRVTEYSGRVNLWLAGGFGILYAVFTVAEPIWPPWLGRHVFDIFNRLGGIPILATALFVLAAVPAAFQYGLWDSNAHDRCKRLELLMLTELTAFDYWSAAAAAAWRRGRGYFAVAVLLLGAGGTAQVLAAARLLPAGNWLGLVPVLTREVLQFVAALSVGVILWGLYFALGFRAFSRGLHANGLGSLLTLGFPLLAYALAQVGPSWLLALVPPGSVYLFSKSLPQLAWLPGPLLAAGVMLTISRVALARCENELKQWYEIHHGRKSMD
ncbi:MAG: hypothetical protein ACK4RK_07415 [Gemmataceae bacterium]